MQSETLDLASLSSLMDGAKKVRDDTMLCMEKSFSRAEEAFSAGRYGEAGGICDDLLKIGPGTPEPMALLGDIEAIKGDPYKAIGLFSMAIESLIALGKAPRGEYNTKLCELFLRVGMPSDAIKYGIQAAGLSPRDPIAFVRLGEAILANGGEGAISKARDSFLKALHIDRDCWEAHQSLGFLLISRGEYGAGFREYEWRKRGPWFRNDPASQMSSAPEWSGMLIPNGNILVVSEGGYGDVIQFSRFLPEVSQYCDKVIFACPPDLAPIIERTNGLTVVTNIMDIPAHSAQVAMMSLPYILGLTERAVEAFEPAYLIVDRSAKLEAFSKPVIGISWRGRETHRYNSLRSVSPIVVAELANEEFSIVSLQKNITKHEREVLERFGINSSVIKKNDDWSHTAAVVSGLDAVVTIDSSVAHLSASMGIDTRIMLPQASEWRWGHGDKTPWYPAAKLYRDGGSGWGDVIQRIRKDLVQQIGCSSAA